MIFHVMACPEDKKVSYVVFMLATKVEFWWHGTQSMIEAHGEAFKERFLGKYFLESA